MFTGGTTRQQFLRMAEILGLTGEEQAVIMYRFGIGDGIVRTIPEVTKIMNREHNYAEDDEYRNEDIRTIESVAIRAINGLERIS